MLSATFFSLSFCWYFYSFIRVNFTKSIYGSCCYNLIICSMCWYITCSNTVGKKLTVPRKIIFGLMSCCKAESSRLSVLAPIKLYVKWYGMHQCFLSSSCFTPCMSVEGGLSVMGAANILTPVCCLLIYEDVLHYESGQGGFTIGLHNYWPRSFL